MKKAIFTMSMLLATQIGFAQATNPAPYCVATFDDAGGFPVDDHISKVSFGTLTNNTNAQYAAPHYVFYNNLAMPNFVQDSSYNMSITFEVAGGCGYGVWIDYNQNNIFEANEKVAGTTGQEMLNLGADVVNKTIKIPKTAKLGNTRMRIRIVEDDDFNAVSTDILPCNASTSAKDVMDWGETEDYTINIKAPKATNVGDYAALTGVVLYPNPTTGMLSLQSEMSTGTYTVEVSSMIGNLVYRAAGMKANDMIDLRNQAKGVYSVRIINQENLVLNDRIVLQ
ncbi:MAG: T9SS type A sorting domain-containing protein [Chitinophagaceae bacterium]